MMLKMRQVMLPASWMMKLGGCYKPALNAINVCAGIKHSSQPVSVPTPWRCTVTAPEHVNVYTNGSWLTKVLLLGWLGFGGLTER